MFSGSEVGICKEMRF